MNTTTTLTDRYVDAAMRSVPEAQREDLATELRGSIDDQIDARTDAGEPRDAAEREVLTALGDPDALAAGYTDRQLFLVGPKYYLDWWRLLKLLYAIVPACAVFGVALGMTIAGESFGHIIGAIWPVLIGVVVHVGFWTTLVFVIVERTGTRMRPTWTVDQLPEPRQRGVGFPELIANLVFLVLGVGAVVWDHLIGFAPAHPGLPFLAEGMWPWWIALLFLVMAIEAGLAIVVYLVGRWTTPLAIVNTLLALAVAVPALALLAQGELLNAEFWTMVIPEESAAEVASIMSVLTGFGIVIIAGWDIVDVWIKAVRARR